MPSTLVSTAEDDIARSFFDDDGDDAGDDDAGGVTSYLRLILPGHYYEFSLTLENFLGFATSSPPFRVDVATGAIPNLIITAGQQYDLLRPAQLAIFAQASVALCPGEKAGKASLTYVWTCSREAAVSTSVDPRYFKIAPFGFNSTQVVAAASLSLHRLVSRAAPRMGAVRARRRRSNRAAAEV